MEQKAQSAIEYLTSYGWALTVIAIVVGVLIYVTSSSTSGVVCQSNNSQIIVKEWVFASGDDSVGFTLQNATGNTISLNSDCVTETDGTNIKEGDASTTACTPTSVTKGRTFKVQNLDSDAADAFNNATATMSYTTAGGLPLKATISCSGTVAATTGTTVIIISSGPYTISQPGQYALSADFSCSGSGNCITIAADNVTLNCQNHTISGSASGTGIAVQSTQNTSISNCTTRQFSYGISISSSNNTTISNNTANNNARGFNIVSSTSPSLSNNTANNNSQKGFYFSNSSGISFNSNTACCSSQHDFYCAEVSTVLSGSGNIGNAIYQCLASSAGCASVGIIC